MRSCFSRKHRFGLSSFVSLCAHLEKCNFVKTVAFGRESTLGPSFIAVLRGKSTQFFCFFSSKIVWPTGFIQPECCTGEIAVRISPVSSQSHCCKESRKVRFLFNLLRKDLFSLQEMPSHSSRFLFDPPAHNNLTKARHG